MERRIPLLQTRGGTLRCLSALAASRPAGPGSLEREWVTSFLRLSSENLSFEHSSDFYRPFWVSFAKIVWGRTSATDWWLPTIGLS